MTVTENKKQLVNILATAREEGIVIDEIPLPLYSPKEDVCLFHFRAEGKLIEALVIKCSHHEMLDLHAFVKEVLNGDKATAKAKKLTK